LKKEESMPFIQSVDDLEANIDTLENYRSSSNINQVEFYKNLIKRGRCFIAYQIDDEYHFAPSRFLGYRQNNMIKHRRAISLGQRDGRDTNRVLIRIIGQLPEENRHLGIKFRQFCKRLGVIPWNINKRRYWNIR
jgi:hypothetical protein